MLNSLRYVGFRFLTPKVDCDYAPAAATSIVGSGPRSNSDAQSTAYDTDSVERFFVVGSRSLKRDRSADANIRLIKSGRRSKLVRPRDIANSAPPDSTTAVIYN